MRSPTTAACTARKRWTAVLRVELDTSVQADARQADLSWSVCYSEAVSELLPAQDVRFDGSSCYVRQQAAAIATQPADLYDQERDGRVWCVDVQHDDHLIFVQRAHRDVSGLVTKVGRTIISGNCLAKFYAELPPPPALRQSPLSTWQCPSCRHMCCCAACRRQKLKRGAAASDNDSLAVRSSAAGGGLGEVRASDIASMELPKLISYALVYLPQFANELIGKHKQKRSKHDSSAAKQQRQQRSDDSDSDNSGGGSSSNSSSSSNDAQLDQHAAHSSNSNSRANSADEARKADKSSLSSASNGSSGGGSSKRQKANKEQMKANRDKRLQAKRALRKQGKGKGDSTEQQRQRRQHKHKAATGNGTDDGVAGSTASASSSSLSLLSSPSADLLLLGVSSGWRLAVVLLLRLS